MRKKQEGAGHYCQDESGRVLTLHEITGQDTGIVIYPGDGMDKEDAVLVCDWTWACRDKAEFPVLVFDSIVIGWPNEDENGYYLKEKYQVDDILGVIPGSFQCDPEEGWYSFNGVDLVTDPDNALVQLNLSKEAPTKGTVYVFKGMTVIAPEGWE